MSKVRDDIAGAGDCIPLTQSRRNCWEEALQDVGAALDTGRREVDIDVRRSQLSDSRRNVERQFPLRDRSRYVLGIVEEFDDNHLPYIAACEDLGVRYKTIDISGPDWIQVVRSELWM
jgi:hypothetical protein